MNLKAWNWPIILAVVSGLAGVIGSIVTPIWGAHLAGQLTNILQGLSGLLVLVAGLFGTHVAATAAKAKRLAATK